MKKSLFVLLTSAAALLQADNLIRNGAFDYPVNINGMNMRLSVYDVGSSIYATQPKRLWRPTPFEGWWIHAESDKADPVVKDGGGFIRLSGSHYAICSDPQEISGEKKAVLSFDIRTKNASGALRLMSMVPGNGFDRGYNGENVVPVPADTNGKFTRITIPFNGINGMAVFRVEVHGGTIDIDNVQIENGLTATPFNVRKGDMLELSLGKFGHDRFPRFWQERSPKQILKITNRSTTPLSGTLRIYLDPWKNAGSTVFKEIPLKNLESGKNITLPVEVAKLENNAYVILAELLDEQGNVIISKDIFDFTKTANGSIGQSQLNAHNGLRFGVYKNVKPAEIFGVGNAMIGNGGGWAGNGGWWGGNPTGDYELGRKLHYTCYDAFFKEDELFNGAVGGAEMYVAQYAIDYMDPEHPECKNPVCTDLDISNPEAQKIMQKRAEDAGKMLAEGPGFASLKMRNEAPYLNNGATCPTPAADKSFREWVKARYKTLDAVNKAWNKKYKSWNEIEQIVSAKMADKKTTVEKTGAAAIDWTAHMGNLTDEVGKLMQEDPGRAMDWFRWRTYMSVKTYGDFRNTVRKYSPETIVGVNMPWPNFWPHVMMPLWRVTDAPMMDMQYACNYSMDLGCTDEMIDMIEMAESTVPDKPIWGIEIYVQPTFKDKAPALQNWGLLAHGMTNNLVFAWRPYADVGYGIFTDTRVWEKNNSKTPMWLMIDTDGTELPLYANNNRSVLEIEEFHKKYNGLSLKRMKSRIGYYIPNDSAEWEIMETLNRPFGGLTGTRITIGAQLRFAGVTLNYLDDAALAGLKSGTLDTIIVPPAPVMNDEAINALADFAEKGGNVVLMGPCGVYDPCLNLRREYGNGKWAKGWKVPQDWKERNVFRSSFIYLAPEINSIRNIEAMPNGEVLKFAGTEVGASKKLGKGRIVFLTRWPARYGGRQIQEPFRVFQSEFIKAFKLPTLAVWQTDPESEKAGFGEKPGEGMPFVEVVLREKSPNERFMFVLNQGGAGKGKVILTEEWNMEDALSGEKLGKTKVLPLAMEDLGYRVFRLTK